MRAYFGNSRLDTLSQCEAMNSLYDQMWIYYNLFQPVLHLIKKEVSGKKLRREWDQAASPYKRLLGKGVLDDQAVSRLDTLYLQTNPRKLRGQMYQERDRLWEAE